MVAQQPQVDVIQGKWQSHAYPVNTGAEFQLFARFGQGITQRISQFFFEQVHADVFCLIIDVYVNVN